MRSAPSGGSAVSCGCVSASTSTAASARWAFRRGRLELTPQLSVEPTLSINWIDTPHGAFRADLLVSRVTYTFTPRMFFGGLVQYNSSTNTISSNLRLRWEYTPGQRAVRGLYGRAACRPAASGPFLRTAQPRAGAQGEPAPALLISLARGCAPNPRRPLAGTPSPRAASAEAHCVRLGGRLLECSSSPFLTTLLSVTH